MTATTYPYISQSYQPNAVSIDAYQLGIGIQNSHDNFIGHSVQSEKYYNEQLKNRFLDLKRRWKSATILSSNSDEIINNPNYIQIINLGNDIIPFILEDLEVTNDHWFVALNKLTNINPISPNHFGNVIQMKNDWLTWARNNNLI